MVIAEPLLRRPAAGTTSLLLPDLLQATDLAADAVISGRYDHLVPRAGLPTDRRWATRIQGDESLDVWLISWAPGAPTQLHHYGESLGALTVLSGSLTEFYWQHGQLNQRRLDAGEQHTFSRGGVHDIVWAPSEAWDAQVPTLSVHAYSPPLTEISHYDVSGEAADAVSLQRTEAIDEP